MPWPPPAPCSPRAPLPAHLSASSLLAAALLASFSLASRRASSRAALILAATAFTRDLSTAVLRGRPGGAAALVADVAAPVVASGGGSMTYRGGLGWGGGDERIVWW
jgi:hypothetical protein